ncbi:hypothetical protein MIND_00023100 [Mycena indigotica]|uniref:Uncharacterized protein n=1 Tax=Mycena indigotica TaxID=2126181 RepID=A0A8H6WDW0_9AGAR|nr:uncharacterized protein MIND_00023100 [Mycena indigotica]KAF7315089.1 hypothetical protein MIND_00023100 [Mycena indigotica]
MSVFLGYARNLFQRGPGTSAKLKSVSTPLFYRTPSGVALLAPAYIALDVFIIINTVNVTWRNWRDPPKPSDEGQLPPLRSTESRLAVCAMEIMVGGFVAAALLIRRAQTAKLFALLPPQASKLKNNQRVFLQSAGNWRDNGKIYPLSACTLTRVRKDALLLQVQGLYGGWQFDMEKSLVLGRAAPSVEDACRDIAIQWREAGGKGTILTE